MNLSNQMSSLKKTQKFNIKDVENDVNYVMIISNKAGLWGYNLGDTVDVYFNKTLSGYCFGQD